MANRQQKSTDQQGSTGQNEEGVDLKYVLHDAKLNLNDKVASCRLRMPPDLPQGLTEHGDDPTLCLYLLPSDKGLIHRLKLMREIVHPNILHATIIHENKMPKSSKQGSERCDYWALVERYDGNLFDYLSKGLGIPMTTKSTMVLLPTDGLRDIVGQILGGLEHLMNMGYYHGNFSLKGTYYQEQKRGEICVKLACFQKRNEKKKTVCLKEYLLDLGGELDQLSKIAEKLNTAADVNKDGPHIETYQINDLAKKLKAVTEANLPHIYPEIKRHPFFWVEDHRRRFFVYEVAVVIKKEDRFRQKIEGDEDICVLPWNADDYDGFLSKMNRHRVSSGRKACDGGSRWAFVKFLVGLYTHEFLLKNEPNKVDHSIMKRHPKICVLLRNLLGSHYADWM